MSVRLVSVDWGTTSLRLKALDAAGEVVAFVDDDAVPGPTWLEQLAAVAEQLRQGKTIEDARAGGCSGCVEVGAFGKEAYILTGYLNLVKLLVVFGLAVLVWWVFFSRAPRGERWAAVAIAAIALGLAPSFLHESVATELLVDGELHLGRTCLGEVGLEIGKLGLQQRESKTADHQRRERDQHRGTAHKPMALRRGCPQGQQAIAGERRDQHDAERQCERRRHIVVGS